MSVYQRRPRKGATSSGKESDDNSTRDKIVPTRAAAQARPTPVAYSTPERRAGGWPVTLVSALAGFGKTTFVSAWVNALDCPVTWLSLDAADDDPGRFLAYLVAALQKVDKDRAT